jgi:anti-anti-sigma factor
MDAELDRQADVQTEPAYALIYETLHGAEAVHVFGEIDLSNAAELEKSLETAAATNGGVILDLTPCTYFDSSIIAVLIRAMKRWGTRFAIVLPKEHRTRRIIRLCNLDHVLPLEPSLVSATTRFNGKIA